MQPPLVLLDIQWLAHRARHSMGGLSYRDEATGVLFGVFQALLDVCSEPRIASNRVVACFDSSSSVRKDFFPGYKCKRGKDRTPEEWEEVRTMKRQLKLLRHEILPEIGFKVARQTGLESDDMIAQAALQVRDRSTNLEAVMVTADGDLYQCITQQTVHWYDPQRNSWLDHMGLWAKKEVEPDDWWRVKCLAGCSGDDVPGIPGVGEKTAVDYIHNRLKETSKKYQAIVSDEGREVFRRNKRLVKLPHRATQPVDLEPARYDPDAFFRWVERLGMRSYLDGGRRQLWERFFDGNLINPHTRGRRRGEARAKTH